MSAPAAVFSTGQSSVIVESRFVTEKRLPISIRAFLEAPRRCKLNANTAVIVRVTGRCGKLSFRRDATVAEMVIQYAVRVSKMNPHCKTESRSAPRPENWALNFATLAIGDGPPFNFLSEMGDRSRKTENDDQQLQLRLLEVRC